MSEWISWILCLCKSQDLSEVFLSFKNKNKKYPSQYKVDCRFFFFQVNWHTLHGSHLECLPTSLCQKSRIHPCIPSLGHQICWLYSDVPWYLDQKTLLAARTTRFLQKALQLLSEPACQRYTLASLILFDSFCPPHQLLRKINGHITKWNNISFFPAHSIITLVVRWSFLFLFVFPDLCIFTEVFWI